MSFKQMGFDLMLFLFIDWLIYQNQGYAVHLWHWINGLDGPLPLW
jgi:hypothetical protein